MHKHFFLFLIGLMSLSCTNKEEKSLQLAQENLELSVDNPSSLKILGVSKVDSAFGINYFTAKELRGIFEVSKKVTDKIMRHTNNLTTFDNIDPSSMSLLERQMKASTEVRSLLLKSGEKGEFSGYKLKIDYQCSTSKGDPYKAESWFFIDKDGKQIIKTFELPLP